MGEATALVKARLVELDASFRSPAPGGLSVEVQFNPETLKVTYQNRPQEQKSTGDQRGNSPRQVMGAGSTKLALQLWFDVNSPGAGGERDVRALTSKVARFMLPASPSGASAAAADRPSPPGVRFTWGTFTFDGLMDSLDETLDFFSPDGRPLRATLNIGLSGQLEIVPPAGGGPDGGAAAGPTAGTRPLSVATAGATLPALAAAAGVGVAAGAGPDWQSVASANGIENPRLLTPGQLIDLNLSAGVQLP